MSAQKGVGCAEPVSKLTYQRVTVRRSFKTINVVLRSLLWPLIPRVEIDHLSGGQPFFLREICSSAGSDTLPDLLL